MIFINLGLPKTSSTNLQINFYPNIYQLNYLGKFYHKKNIKQFSILCDFINGKITLNDNAYKNLLNDFKKEIDKKKYILISEESWVVPYHLDIKTNKGYVVPQHEKLKRLKQFMQDLNVEPIYFIIRRNYIDSLKSLFITLNEKICKIFGDDCGNFETFVKKYLNKDKDYEQIKLFFNVYDLKFLKEIFSGKLHIFDYDDIVNNKYKFLKDLNNMFRFKIDRSLVSNLSIITRKTKVEDSEYYIIHENKILKFFKKIIPYSLHNKLTSIKLTKKITSLLRKKNNTQLSQKYLYQLLKRD